MSLLSPPLMPALIIAAGAVPAGFAAAWASRRLAQSIHPSAPAMIALSLALGVWAASVMPPGPLLAVTCALGWALLVLAAVDALAFRLPDILTLPLIATGVAVAWLLPDRDVLGHTIGAFAGLAFFYAIAEGYRMMRGREGLGLGDVKLAGAAGAWLGWEALPFVVLVACMMGLVWVGVATVRRGREAMEERIPFGVALALAIWAIWLYGLPDVFDPGI
jgi:leader peptidase (prepilin peptidase)/N-methyltransferase